MQTKASVRSLPVWQLPRAFSVAVAILFLAAATLVADPPGPAQIELEPAMTEPSVSLGVEVTLVAANHGGTGPFTYLWRRNGQEISGADTAGPRLNLGAVESADAGEYTVLVQNAEGEALSAPLQLQVDPTFVNVLLPTEGRVWSAEWVDINNDGWLDLSAVVWVSDVTSWHLFLNSRDGAFVSAWKETFTNGGDLAYRGYGDYDNDGFPDAAIGHDTASPLRVYHNDGGRGLKRVWQGPGPYFHCEWADLDNDGYLDLVQLHPWGRATVHLNDHDGPPFHPVNKADEPGWALRNVRESHYTAWGDYDDDGRLDLYVTGCTVPGQLFRNLDGGNFVAADFQGPANVSLDAEWVDYDGDHDLDLVITYFWGGVDVYRNDGAGSLVPMTAAELGDLATDVTDYSPVMAWADYDNDGDLDLYRSDMVGSGLDSVPAPGRLYVNQGEGRFVRVLAGSPTTGMHGYVHTASWGDFDRDGFLDLIGSPVVTENGSLVYRNNLPRTGNANHWLEVRCEGRVSNRDAIGAKVRVQATMAGKERWQLRQIVRPGCGGPPLAHFGLGDAPRVEVLRIEWPSGIVQEFRDLAADQFKTVKEPPRLVSTGPCEFEVQCWPGMRFTVEASADLKTWSSVGTVTHVNGTARFSDAVGVHGTCRFYRVVDD